MSDYCDLIDVVCGGFIGALTLLFIALKLLGKISWSWWWVLSPLWISFIATIIILIIVILFISSTTKGK